MSVLDGAERLSALCAGQRKKGCNLIAALCILVAKDLRHLVDLAREARLQVSGLVLVDDVGLCQLIQHLLHAGVKLRSLVLVGHSTQLAYGITHGLGVILVVKLLLLVLADSFE